MRPPFSASSRRADRAAAPRRRRKSGGVDPARARRARPERAEARGAGESGDRGLGGVLGRARDRGGLPFPAAAHEARRRFRSGKSGPARRCRSPSPSSGWSGRQSGASRPRLADRRSGACPSARSRSRVTSGARAIRAKPTQRCRSSCACLRRPGAAVLSAEGPLVQLRRMGLSLVDRIPPLKRWLAHEAMGWSAWPAELPVSGGGP